MTGSKNDEWRKKIHVGFEMFTPCITLLTKLKLCFLSHRPRAWIGFFRVEKIAFVGAERRESSVEISSFSTSTILHSVSPSR
jgi:hypothetical protein